MVATSPTDLNPLNSDPWGTFKTTVYCTKVKHAAVEMNTMPEAL
jgi:hypothetical protein